MYANAVTATRRLLLIGKAKNPRCLNGINQSTLPVIYRNQRNAWVNTEIFSEWFHEQFVPYARAKLSEIVLEAKSILFLNNCSAHPEAEDLISDDGKFRAHFLRPNVTSLIQPMDQRVLESMKRIYRNNLLRDLVSKDSNEMIPFLKNINMLHVNDRISIAWNQVTLETIRKSWRKLIPFPAPTVCDETAGDQFQEITAVLDETERAKNSQELVTS